MNATLQAITIFVFILALVAVIIVVRYDNKKNPENARRYIITTEISILFSSVPILISIFFDHSVLSGMMELSFEIALSIMVLYLSTKIPQFISRYRSIEKFRAQAYGIAVEMCSHTRCDYSKLKDQMDDALRYYDAKNLSFRCSEESRIAFMSNQAQRFVYLCALDYVWQYVDEDMEKKSVEAYCVPPPSKTGLGFDWHIKNPFWKAKSQEAGFVGFGVAITVIATLLGINRS